MTTKTLTFSDTRGGVSNDQTVQLDDDLLTVDGNDRVQITITIDENGPAGMTTRVDSHGMGDVNELADFLVNLGHQIGHDLGKTCHIKALLLEQLAKDSVADALANLLGGKAGE